MACPRCGSETPDGARFCPKCGAQLAIEPGQQERKLVSILFVDIVGSTARADGADPEDVSDRNKLYFDECRGRIERHGGAVEKYVGDAVMAVFGAPLSRADDAERAVRAGLSILEGIEVLNARHVGLDLQVRAAVGTGEAVIAVDPAPGDPLATGDVVNTAARLQSAAAPGSLVVDEQTHRLARHAFRFGELPAVEAKGKAAPVAAWSILEAVQAPGNRPTSATPLVGRDRELELIEDVWGRAVDDRRPHIVTIVAPAGFGKTRLASEAAELLEASGGRALWGRSLPYEEQTPYRAAGVMVRRVAGIFDNDPVEVARTKLAAAVVSLFPDAESADATRYLSLLLGLGLDAPADEPVHLLYTMRMFVQHLAERQPVLLVFEDVHWADQPLLELIDHLVSHVRDTRLVVIALARPEFLESRRMWGGGLVGQTTVPLEPLAEADARAVAAALLPSADPSAIDRVVSRAEGNPLFLEELVASVSDEVPLEELPSTVRAAIAARIDALPADARAALLHASVIGQTFWRDVLTETGELEAVDEALDGLEARGLVARNPQSQVEGDAEFAFKHVLIRDVAYGTLPRSSRRTLHGAVARYLEAALADPEDLGWLLAHHWREAGELDAARGYLLGAAERARDALAVEQTYDLYTRALELATDDDERRRVRLRRALALTELEDYQRADAELTELVGELEGDDEVEGLIAASRAALWTEQSAKTMSHAERAVELVRSRGPAELEAMAVSRLAQALGMRGEEGDLERAIELGEEASELWPDDERLLELSEHFHMIGNVHYWMGHYEVTLELSERAAATGGLEPRSAEFLLRGAGQRGLALAGLGRYEEAIEVGSRSIETARRLGRKDNVVMNYSTTPLREIFAVAEARERSETVADRLGPSWFNMAWLSARTDVVAAQVLMDDFAPVERVWDDLWETSAASPSWERWIVTGRLAASRAELELAAGRLDDALTWCRRAIDRAKRAGRRKYVTVSLTTLGRALTASG
ncbi:MAG: ATP-binding protein, partial [Actinomycetota bacterium]